MKPIKLEIAGLQSFIDKQIVDFSAAEGGIFGIFGKTGSGKSTILDGITLALFGYVTRISKNAEFINSKCTKTEVKLVFESDGKVYEVYREFKLKKNGGVDSYAYLKQVESETENMLAEGSFQTDKKVQEIIGLSPTEFCQVIALPQGKFAEFLQAKPAERTALISNIFDITKYAENLYNKAKDNFNAVENEINMLEAEKSGVGGVSIDEVNEKQKMFNDLEEELNVLKAKVDDKNNAYMGIIENASLKKDQIALKSRLEELYKQSGEIKELKSELLKYESAKKLEVYFNRRDKVVEQLKSLNEEVTKLREQKQEQEMFFRDYEEQYKKFESMQKSALVELDAKKIKVLELQEDKFMISNLKQENDRLNKELDEKKIEIEKSKAELKLLDEQNLNLEQNIGALRVQRKELEEKKNDFEIVAENKSIESEIILIEEFENQLEKIVESYKEELKELKSDYAILYKREQEQTSRMEEISRSVDRVLGKSDKTLVQRYREVLGRLSGMDNVQDKFDFVASINNKTKTDSVALIQKAQEIDDKIEKSKALLQEKIQIVNKFEGDLKQAQTSREEFLGENVLSLLVQNVDLGDSCPICKSRVQTKNNIASTDLSGLDREITNIKSALNFARKDKEKAECEVAVLTAQSQFIKAQVDKNRQSFESLKNAQEKLYMEYVDKNDKQAENFKSMHEATYSISVALEKLLIEKDRLFDSTLKAIEERALCGAKIQATNEYLEKLTDVLYYLEKSRAEREFSIYNAQNEHGVDFKVASKNLNALNEQLENVLESIEAFEEQKTKLINERYELSNKISLQVNEFNALNIKSENVLKTIEEKENKFVQLGFNIEDDDPLKQINEKQQELNAKAEEFLSSYNLKLAQKDKYEKEYELKLAILNDKNEELREAEASLSNVSRAEGFESEEDAKKYIVSDNIISSATSRVDEFEKEVSIVNVQLTNINEKIGNTDIDIEQVDKLKNELEQEKIKLSEKQVYFGVLQAELSEMKNKKAKLEKIDERMPKLKQRYDLAKELYSLLRGKTLAEFMANEYVEMIIMFANEKLRILDGGRYKLLYENKEFYVEDNLNDGIKRVVSTLSGGETFLVSLSLALAISDVISMQSDKKINFFFLDEGFGTLDSELSQTVMQALYRLKSENLNIGIITHVQELQAIIPFKFIVTKANENSGSKVQFETGL